VKNVMLDRNRAKGRLEGKVAVITGGNSGIGLATARLFKAEGASLAIFGRDKKSLAAAVELIGKDTLSFSGDISSLKDLDDFYEEVKQRFRRVDVVFANAGIASSSPFVETTEDLLMQILEINVKGLFFTVQKALPLMSKGGAVVLMSSMIHLMGMPGSSAYSASKGAVRALTRVLAAELIDSGIRVNAIAPGPTETPILGRTGLDPKQIPGVKDQLRAIIPMKRMGTPEEIAKAVLFLASDESSFTIGEELTADGGMTQI
jgi:NAD(P)-dependent dehydrogenase (short-subunit alcohol dehydrogenase family)